MASAVADKSGEPVDERKQKPLCCKGLACRVPTWHGLTQIAEEGFEPPTRGL
jgi:hypothetical protein